MNDSEKDVFGFGYWECRSVIVSQLKEILRENSDGDIVKLQVKRLINELERDAKRKTWDEIQKEFPGITETEYEAELEASGEEIRKTYYSEKGFLKPRLVWQAPESPEK